MGDACGRGLLPCAGADCGPGSPTKQVNNDNAVSQQWPPIRLYSIGASIRLQGNCVHTEMMKMGLMKC